MRFQKLLIKIFFWKHISLYDFSPASYFLPAIGQEKNHKEAHFPLRFCAGVLFFASNLEEQNFVKWNRLLRSLPFSLIFYSHSRLCNAQRSATPWSMRGLCGQTVWSRGRRHDGENTKDQNQSKSIPQPARVLIKTQEESFGAQLRGPRWSSPPFTRFQGQNLHED